MDFFHGWRKRVCDTLSGCPRSAVDPVDPSGTLATGARRVVLHSPRIHSLKTSFLSNLPFASLYSILTVFLMCIFVYVYSSTWPIDNGTRFSDNNDQLLNCHSMVQQCPECRTNSCSLRVSSSSSSLSSSSFSLSSRVLPACGSLEIETRSGL